MIWLTGCRLTRYLCNVQVVGYSALSYWKTRRSLATMAEHTIHLTFTTEADTMLEAIFELRRAMMYMPTSKLEMFDVKLSTDNAQPVRHADE
jgi:hypothetical protein